MSAAAPSLELIHGRQPAPAENAKAVAERGGNTQPSLFSDLWPSPKVVPIPTLTPVRSQAGPRRASLRAQGTRGGASQRRQVDSHGADFQQSLDFHDAALAAAPPDTAILCDAPVATPMHRLMATAADASMIAIAAGLFLGVFYFSGGHIALTKQTALLVVGIVATIGILYRTLWSLGNGETPGMRFAGLRLVNFDGQLPGRQQRGLRQAAYLLSLISVGVGLVWALVDEENLTWHDHISKTFPTPV
jgi:uncharacterized RDD family membrane protein YckC